MSIEIRFKEEVVRFYAALLVIGLGNFHEKGIVYRDLKPENILIRANGYICLTDFGMQRLLKLKTRRAKYFYGTPEYLAPETIIGQEQTKASD